MWDLATCANGEPNVVPVAFKDVTEDGKLVVGDVFLETTLNNIKANGGKIAISVYDAKSLEGYQIKGTSLNATGTTFGSPFAHVARSHIPFFNTLITDSFSIECTSCLSTINYLMHSY